MGWIHFEPVFVLTELIKSRGMSFEDKFETIEGSTIDDMFNEFQVNEGEREKVLKAIFEENFSREGLSKDASELVSYIESLKEKEREILSFAAEILPEEETIWNEVIERAREYLPENASFESFELFFTPMPRNARITPRSAYCDPLFALEVGKEGLISLCSHLAHHIGRGSIAKEFDFNPDSINDLIVEKFVFLEAEGIANCVSDARNLPTMNKLKEFRDKIEDEFSGYLDILQELYLGYHRGEYKGNLESLKEKAWLLNSFIVPAGCRMAFEIEKAFGREALVKTVGKPLEFLKLYQKAAEENNLFLFEEETFEYLEEDLQGPQIS
ncbi:hypothetical protein AT15_01795 [Kosmotoga arenicorallina S304]|uniref:Uncharacterized protein n=1 Tax=Kosmotoga arenicorallina S304 TaxID=1453497 RepID=A0A176JZD0_9BACT|nr:DUF5700 domain-containing putative Zn-dependent protease [Kosmotoga arenicorallina]OAA29432.1 hypothetical protein AT15_01795 [Kosmotoga arenicorallina S304]